MGRSWWFHCVVCLVLVSAAHAQAVPDTTIGAALRSLASRADRVLVGQVVAIQRKQGSVEITLRVDQTIVGPAVTQYTLREWAGLWPPGQHRYVVGERAMIFLHAPSAAGLSSAVDGMEGVVPLVPAGLGNDPLLDVRRLFTRVLRAQDAPLPGPESSAVALSEAAAVVVGWRGPSWREPVLRALPPGLVPVQTLPPSSLPVRRSGPIEAPVDGVLRAR